MRRIGLAIILGLAAAAAPLAAQEASPLTAADLGYLKTLGYSKADLEEKKPTPEMLEKLHRLINDPATQGKAKARADAVYRQMDHIEAVFIWCTDHPMDEDCGSQQTATK